MYQRPPRLVPVSRANAAPHDALLAAAVLAVVAASVPAQRQFDPLGQSRLPTHANNYTVDVALGDVDGDGDLDMVLAKSPNRLYLNDGTGTYSDATAGRLPTNSDVTSSVALGDVDGDGDLDIVFGNLYRPGSPNRLYFNDGTGTYTEAPAARMPFDRDNTTSVALADVDGDGDLDMVVGNVGYVSLYAYYPGARDRLYLNDGTGTFTDATAARMPAVRYDTSDVALGDFDGDGDLDMVSTHWRIALYNTYGQQNRLYLNDGTGTYADATLARMPVDNQVTRVVASGDVDGDGDLDLFFGNLYGQQNRLYLNDGTATFTDATAASLPTLGDETIAVAMGDVDGDGDLDMVLATINYPAGRPNRLYLNDGSGIYSDATAARMPADRDLTYAAALADVDGDGDLDAVFGNLGGKQDKLYLNLLRQLDTPFKVFPGDAYTLDLYARYGIAGNGDLAYPILSSGTANVPLPPFGTLFLDPSALAVLAPLVLLQPAGMSRVSLLVPNVPSLVGTSLYSQALIVHQAGLARFTNLTADVIQ